MGYWSVLKWFFGASKHRNTVFAAKVRVAESQQFSYDLFLPGKHTCSEGSESLFISLCGHQTRLHCTGLGWYSLGLQKKLYVHTQRNKPTACQVQDRLPTIQSWTKVMGWSPKCRDLLFFNALFARSSWLTGFVHIVFLQFDFSLQCFPLNHFYQWKSIGATSFYFGKKDKVNLFVEKENFQVEAIFFLSSCLSRRSEHNQFIFTCVFAKWTAR